MSFLVWRPAQCIQPLAPDAVKVTKGAENVATYAKTELSQRKFCRLCGGHLMAAHPPLEMIGFRRDNS